VIQNKYAASRYKGSLSLIGLVESVKGSGLGTQGPQVFTQTDLQGLMLRCLMIIRQPYAWDMVADPPKQVPTLQRCLQYIAKGNSPDYEMEPAPPPEKWCAVA
jgi:hypothetical protein